MAQLATDNFNRADSLDLGANWTPPAAGFDPLQIVSNAVRPQTITIFNGEYYSAISWPADQYSECRLIAIPATNGPGPAARMSTTDQTFYVVNANTGGLQLFRVLAGSVVQIGSSATVPVVGDILRIEAQGTTIRVLLNSVQQISVVDANIATGQAGIFVYEATAVTNSQLDEWAGGDFAGSTPFNEEDPLSLLPGHTTDPSTVSVW